MDPKIKELRIKTIVAFILAVTSLELLSLGSIFRSFFSYSLNINDFVNTFASLMVYGVPISMCVVSLVFVSQAKEITNNPYRIFKGFAYGLSIASLIIYGLIYTFSFFAALISGGFSF